MYKNMSLVDNHNLNKRCLRIMDKKAKEFIATVITKEKMKKLLREIVVSSIAGIVVAVILAIWAGITGIYQNIQSIPDMATKEDIKGMVTKDDIKYMVTTDDIKDMVTNDDIEDMVTKDDIDPWIDAVNSLDKKYDELNRTVGKIEGRLGIAVEPNDYFISTISHNFLSSDTGNNKFINYVFTDLDINIGTDANTGEEYTAGDLRNAPIVLSYTDENNDEVFFKGQYNDNNQWNGNCIINKYTNGNLKYVLNAEYASGKLVSYKQVFSYINNSNIEVWAVSDRTVEGEENAGQTWTFFKEGEYIKNFDNSYLKSENIIDDQQFLNSMNLMMEGFYNGYTSDGLFNDQNDDAYMVKYNRNGYVRMLYAGQFQDGKPHDPTGNAWVISLGYDDIHYMYYRGVINNLDEINENNGWKHITIEEINQTINNDNYACPINWYDAII